MGYILSVSSSSLTPDEVRAAAETHNELGKDYSAAVIESFLEKVGSEIDARVDARLNRYPGPAEAPRSQAKARKDHGGATTLGVLSVILGIPLTAIVAYSPAKLWGLLVVWMALAVINIAYNAASVARSHEADQSRGHR
jgi:F0F1-type ATP synthase assembly protein I